MKKLLLYCTFLSALVSLQAQDRAWVLFTDKGPEASHYLTHPESVLSPMALAKRQAKGLDLQVDDLPVSRYYLQALANLNPAILGQSRWLNAAVVESSAGDWEAIRRLPFVKEIRPVASLVRASVEDTDWVLAEAPAAGLDPMQYGQAQHQNEMLSIMDLHRSGNTGRGVRIAVFDGGFTGTDTIAVFDSLRHEGRIIAAYDFVGMDDNPYHGAAHGTQVLSTIAANLPGKMIGTAPHASILLARTEDVRSETRQEEHNWVMAVEWADSIGVDIIHSSLGYSTFDSESESYTYEQMDGKASIITRAADMAAARGIIVTSSAGNEGNKSWRYITAPCDGDSVLCIGSVDKYQERSYFSSIGPSADGRIKPDVTAMGTRTRVASPNNRIYGSNGTSFSSPLVAGFMACLRQAHPERSNMDLILATRLSGDQAGLPDNEYGYGIPHAGRADSLLRSGIGLDTLRIVMAEKPFRGRQPMPVPTAPAAEIPPKALATATKLRSDFRMNNGLIILKTESDARLRSVKLMRGKQKVVLAPKDLVRTRSEVQIKTQFLLPGAYQLRVKTSEYEETIPFQIE